MKRTWGALALVAGLGLWPGGALAVTTCEKACDEDVAVCQDYCKQYAGRGAPKCQQACVKEKTRCMEGCESAAKAPAPPTPAPAPGAAPKSTTPGGGAK